MKKFIPEAVDQLAPYVPGRLISEVKAQFGLDHIIKLASNENCLGFSPLVLEALKEALPCAYRYSDPDAIELKQALIAKYGFDFNTLVCGNGSSEFIVLLCHLLLSRGLNAIMSRPSFIMYASNVQAGGGEAIEVPVTCDYGHD
ncbi:MAG: aminotransferase class I/II-fold pyridoxal phosphate-dependent enzyme, partial [Candidatus Adiutrix sp.]